MALHPSEYFDATASKLAGYTLSPFILQFFRSAAQALGGLR